MARLELLDHQYNFVESDKKYTLISSGLGSGKSFAGACWVLTMISKYKCTGGIFANTYKQLRNATLKTLFRILDENKIPYSFNKVDSILKINNIEVYCYSLDNYDAIRGVEIGWAWLDEAAYAEKDAWDVVIGRVRHKGGNGQVKVTTTPRGFNWLYEFFVEQPHEDRCYFTASTKDNTYLPDDYHATLLKSYDSKMQEQELEGKFVNISTGRIYYNFDRVRHTHKLEKGRSFRPYIGMDFNINPMTAIVFTIEHNKMYVWDEFFIMDANTDIMAVQLKQKYGSGLEIIPDATGKRLVSSSAGKSDHDILRNHGFIIPSVRNPYRRDRYNLINKMLEDDQLIINESCTKLIKDLEKIAYKEGSDMPDTSDPLIGHITDALGYGAYHFFSLDNSPSRSRTFNLFKDE